MGAIEHVNALLYLMTKLMVLAFISKGDATCICLDTEWQPTVIWQYPNLPFLLKCAL